MKIYDYKEKMKEYIISYFRTNNDILNIINTLANRFNYLQSIIAYLLRSLDIRYARGQRLDFIGSEVGASRDETDYGNYFCVNRSQINKRVDFYFLTSMSNPRTPLTLKDAEFTQKIYAHIGANSASGTVEEVINIVKNITNAEKVSINDGANGGIKILIQGCGLILTRNTISYIKQIIGNGIYIEEITTNDQTN